MASHMVTQYCPWLLQVLTYFTIFFALLLEMCFDIDFVCDGECMCACVFVFYCSGSNVYVPLVFVLSNAFLELIIRVHIETNHNHMLHELFLRKKKYYS